MSRGYAGMTRRPQSNERESGDVATRIMERMVRMPPKQHKDMKLGKPKAKISAKANPSKKRRRSAEEIG
jgi:hypothetical protein